MNLGLEDGGKRCLRCFQERERRTLIKYVKKRYSWDREEDVGNEEHKSVDQLLQNEWSAHFCS